MHPMRPDPVPPGAHVTPEQAIRATLLATPGAVLCARCTVITQGGRAGAQAHVQTVHPEKRRPR